MSSSTDESPAVRVLAQWPTPFVVRVLIALKLKGVKYEIVKESELLLSSNPPVLLHHGKPISESLIIVQYIDEVWPLNGPLNRPSLLPSDPYARAIERFWAQYIDDKLPPAIEVLRGTGDGDKDEAAGQMSTALQHLEEAFVRCGEGKDYFGGDSIGYLDIALGTHVGWVKKIDEIRFLNEAKVPTRPRFLDEAKVPTRPRFLDEAKVPNLAAWADRLCAHPAVVDAKYGFFKKSVSASE